MMLRDTTPKGTLRELSNFYCLPARAGVSPQTSSVIGLRKGPVSDSTPGAKTKAPPSR